jgi:PIN domain nuclease of toxin-antitoxin system
MARFFLDTHVAYWLVSESPKLDENLRDDILYPSGNQYLINDFVILELTHLNQIGKLKIPGGSKALFGAFESMNIEMDLITERTFGTLENIPILTIGGSKHTDMMDRAIIAHCIANKGTLISHDSKFPYYRTYGLKLLEA